MIDWLFWYIGAVFCGSVSVAVTVVIFWYCVIEIPWRYTKLGQALWDTMKDAHRYRVDQRERGG